MKRQSLRRSSPHAERHQGPESAISEIDGYFLSHEEPLKGYLLYLRRLILTYDKDITEAWRYGMPFFFHKGRRFSYLWVQKRTRWPYIGFVDGKKLDHPDLLLENRSRMKTLLLDPYKDVPVRKIKTILKMALNLRT